MIPLPRFWLIPLLLWSLLIGASYVWNASQLSRHMEHMALERGRFVFELVESLRLWNARHGGVFVPVTDSNPPNPFLAPEGRDYHIDDNGGLLTKINPAYMTRQLADVVAEQHQLLIHITSLKPLNPTNQADHWERDALKAFEQGSEERFSVLDQAKRRIARYMAPLVTKPACLACHAKQGYKVGDIRGGISITFPTTDLEAPLTSQYRSLLFTHLTAWLLLCGLSLFYLHRQRQGILALQHERDHQESLVAERTTELSHEVQERKHAEEQLRLLLESSGEGIYGVNSQGECIFCNPAALRLLGYDNAEALLGKSIHQQIHHSHADHSHYPETECPLSTAYLEGRSVHADDEVFWRADGSAFPVEYWAHPIHDADGVIGSVVNFSDITARKQMHERIWYQANYDALTGQPNRNLFHDRLAQMLAIAEREQTGVSLMYLDLDLFKDVNDRFGHDAGDILLQRVAQRILNVVRASDTLARMGGDEFTLLLDTIDLNGGVQRVANEVISALEMPFIIEGNEITISASIGIACFPTDADNAPDLLRCADQAMYHAKSQGRNQLAIYRDIPKPR